MLPCPAHLDVPKTAPKTRKTDLGVGYLADARLSLGVGYLADSGAHVQADVQLQEGEDRGR